MLKAVRFTNLSSARPSTSSDSKILRNRNKLSGTTFSALSSLTDVQLFRPGRELMPPLMRNAQWCKVNNSSVSERENWLDLRSSIFLFVTISSERLFSVWTAILDDSVENNNCGWCGSSWGTKLICPGRSWYSFSLRRNLLSQYGPASMPNSLSKELYLSQTSRSIYISPRASPINTSDATFSKQISLDVWALLVLDFNAFPLNCTYTEDDTWHQQPRDHLLLPGGTATQGLFELLGEFHQKHQR